MRIKDGFLLQPFADHWVAVSDSACAEGNVFISLNSLGAFLWEQLQENCGFDQLLQKVLDTFCVEEPIARRDLEKFLCDLERAGLLIHEYENKCLSPGDGPGKD